MTQFSKHAYCRCRSSKERSPPPSAMRRAETLQGERECGGGVRS
jgi:hypothetical protein